jgi:hypothetical protein
MTTQPQPLTLNRFTETLLNRMNKQLDTIGTTPTDEIQTSKKSITLVYDTLLELNTYIVDYKFNDPSEEVTFFRRVKPQFIKPYLFYQKVFALKVNEPFTESEKSEYYHKQLTELQTFRNEHKTFYAYCLSDDEQFDQRYFTRQSSFPNPEIDKRVATGYDTLLATLLANDELKIFMAKQRLVSNTTSFAPALTWTAPKAALIELVYALKAANTFNNGTADLKQIATELEKIFQISLGNYYRVYQDIRLRKSGQTNFLDTLKDQFIRVANEMDAG